MLAKPKYTFIPEVVREPKMHFFDVPKLGSYLAVELKYNSCLYEESLDNAYAEFINCRKAKID